MGILASVNRGIKRYGDDVEIVRNGKTIKSKAFIQPLRYKNKMYVSGETLPAGFYDGGHYLYIGLNNVKIDKDYRNIIIYRNNKGYIIRRAENYIMKSKILYIWAILTPYIKPMEDDYE